MAKRNFTIDELKAKTTDEILELVLSGELDKDAGKLALKAKADDDSAKLKKAEDSKTVNIAETRLQKDGMLLACPGKPLSGFQAVRYLSQAAKLTALMVAAYDEAGGKLTTEAVEERAFGKGKDEKQTNTIYRFGKLVIGRNNEKHADEVRAFIVAAKAAATASKT